MASLLRHTMANLFPRGLRQQAASCCRAYTAAAPRRMPRRPAPSLACRRCFSPSAARRTENDERQWSTPLARQLADAIAATGPIPLASYMRMCLTSDVGGYYTGALADTGRDPFGRTGDFVTSPEVSQVFGELVGIWFVAEWMAQGRPAKGVELIEVGPGRGTLMADVLRTIRHFGLAKSIDAVYMVEASAQLRATQKDLLCGPDAAPLTESKVGYHGTTRHGALPIVWTETIQAVPKNRDSMPLIVAHEFFDALPIHTFQSVAVPPAADAPPAADQASPSSTPPKTPPATPRLQWREMVVTPTPPGATHESLGTPLSQRPQTPGEGGGDASPVPDFQLTLAPGVTRHSRYLPEMSARYRRLLQPPQSGSGGGGGAIIEICPDAALYAAEFATRIGGSAQHPKPSARGAALILDYGPGDGSIPINSLRGIRRHQRVSPFAEPGLTDLSADVDFEAIAEQATLASDGVEVHGPVDQADFLLSMGIRERAEALQRVAEKTDKADEADKTAGRAADIERSWKRLVDRGPNGMGKVYKALAILPENAGRRRPVGFGGDVVQ